MESTFVMVQMESAAEPAENLKKAAEFVKRAAEKFHADFIIFPETFMYECLRGTAAEKNSRAESLDGAFVSGMRKLAGDYGVWIVFGMKEKTEDPEDVRVYNSVVMLNAAGEIVRVYHKTHLYDAFGFRESEEIRPGDALFEPVETPFGKIGIFVCYEVRFPEVARYECSGGAEIILMPTAWVKGDLKSLHFQTLVTARAIENTVYMLACDQYSRIRMGESLAVDPMGVTLAGGGDGEKLIPVYIDTERIRKVREKLPSFKDRRPELYTER